MACHGRGRSRSDCWKDIVLNRYYVIAALAFCIVIGAIWFFRSGDRDARQINRRLDELVETVEKRGNQSSLRQMTQSQAVPGFFSADATIRMAPLYASTLGRRETAQTLYLIHNNVDRLTVRVRDRRLDINHEEGTAEMRITLTGGIHQGGRRESYVHTFQLNWIKEDRDWFIRQVELVQAIRPPGAGPAEW